MNLLNNGGNKKKWIIGSITAFVILLIILIIIFWDKLPFTPKPEDTEPELPEQYIPDGGGNFRPDHTDDGFIVDDKRQYIVPNEFDEDTEIVSYSDEGNYLALKVKDKDGNVLEYAVKHDTIIFDAKTNKVILPSKLVGKKGVKILSSTSETLTEDGDKVEPNKNKGDKDSEVQDEDKKSKDTNKRTNTHDLIAIIPNAPKNLHYTPVYSLEKTEEYVYILNLDTKTRYRLERTAKTVNALSGLEISENDLVFGDRLFIYEGKTVPEHKFEVEEDDYISPELVDSLTTTEGKNSKYFETVKEDDLLSKDFKTIDVAEVYVYPQTAP